MSYGLRYTFTFREETGTANTGTLYKVNIYKSGWGGGSTSVKAGDNPLSLSYKKQDLISPICGSELTIGLMSITNGEFIEFATASPLQYYVDVLKSTDNGVTWTTYWSGVNTTDCYTEPYKNAPYPINLKFNCGLGELQWHRYEQAGSLVAGLESLILTVSNCLSFLPYTKNVREIINIREDNMLDSKGFLEQCCLGDMSFTELADDGELHGISCNKLLNQILTALNCRIYQSNNMWYVERIFERTHTSMTYFDYTLPGAFELPGYSITNSASGTFDPRLNINNASAPKMIDGGDWGTTQKKPSLAYQYNTKSLDNVELVANPFFEDTPTTKTSKGEPTQWDFGSALTPYINSDIGLKTIDVYTNDIKYRTGLCFSTTVMDDFMTNVNANYKASKAHYGDLTGLDRSVFDTNYDWAIHAVRRPGDAVTNPYVYIDTANGSLQADLRYYFSYKVTPGAPLISSNDLYMMFFTNSTSMCLPICIRVTDSLSNTYELVGYDLQCATIVNQWSNTSETVGSIGGGPVFGTGSLNQQFPDQQYSGQSTPLTSGQLESLCNSKYGSYFYWNFLAKYSLNIPFNTSPSLFGTKTGAYKFDLYMWPPIFGSGNASDPFNSQLKTIAVSLDSFGINTVDFQYKDSFNSVSGYTSFYRSSDNDVRWNEQKVSVLYGDTLTPGYPGSFRLGNSNPTQSWHNTGESNVTGIAAGLVYSVQGTGAITYNSNTYSAGSSFTGVIGFTSYTITTGSPTVVAGGNILADILFQNYESLIANYRTALTAKIYNPGGIGFWQNINDGVMVYAQTGNKLDFKKAMLTIDMEEVSKDPATISKTFTSLSAMPLRKMTTNGNYVATAPPALTIAATPVARVSVISNGNVPRYPAN